MTVIYVPRLIESAEQAEALPEETIAYLLHDDGFTDGLAMRLTQTTGDPRAWRVMGRFALATHEMMRGWTALVPIEAEEEWSVGHEAPAWAPGTEEWARAFQAHEPGRRLFRRSTTPWEEA